MSEEFGGNFISISDDEGNSYELEHLDTLELDGVFYLAFLPADVDENSSDFGMVILRSEGDPEDGDSYLVIPEDDELETVYEKFMERLFPDDDENGEDAE